MDNYKEQWEAAERRIGELERRLFVMREYHELEIGEKVQALIAAGEKIGRYTKTLISAEQTLRNLASGWLEGESDIQLIVRNEAKKIQEALDE